MAKKPTITSITSGYASTNTLNDNFEALRDAFDNTLSLDGSTPNSMTSDLNLNNNDILNASRILVGGVDYIATALSYKNAAEAAQTAAETAQAAAELVYDNFDDRYLGSKASDPTLDNDGDALLDGALYYDTINTVMKFYDTSTSTWYRTTPTTSDQANIDIVAGNTTNINTVAGISSDVTTVAGISSDVTTVAADGTDIGTVATSISNVNTTATNISNINTVAGISANVTTVAGNTSNINTVATDISNVNTVAGQTTNLQNVTDNLTAIQNAATNATNAATSASNAATSETNAATSASNASTSETNAASSATAAAASAAAAEASADFFDDVYLGSKASDPSVDNDGDALNAGDLYFNTTSNTMRVYSGSAWQDAAVDSSGFVQTTGDTMTGDLSFGDNDKAIFGDGNDLEIYHDGATGGSYIRELGSSSLFIQGANVVIEDPDGNNMIRAADGGEAQLYHNGSEKLATTSTGVDITGTLTSDGLTVDGTVDISSYLSLTSTAVSIDLIETDLSDVNTRIRHTGGDVYFQTLNDAKTVGTNRLRLDHSTGDISFYEDTGTTAKFFWDASAEQLALGTAFSSVTPFTISKSVGSGGAIAYFDATGTNDNGLVINVDDPGVFLSDWRIAETSVMRLDDNGNLGIGTSSPLAILDVKNATNEHIVVSGSSAYGNNAIVGVNDSGGEVGLGLGGNTVEFYTAATERMRIDSSGNVGVGNTTPSSYNSGSNNLVIGNGGTNGISIHAGTGMLHFTNGADTTERVSIKSTVASNTLEFSNGNGEAMRIDSIGNLLVGKTTTDIGTQGILIKSSGRIEVAKTSATTLFLNRLTSDGDIIDLRKDGTTVGTIGAKSGALYIGGALGNDAYLFMGNNVIKAADSTGSGRDNAISLGDQYTRFTDLYLSGGVYLGGTGSANKLDDYEEGTWTPATYGASTATISSVEGLYTKIGNMVYASFTFNVDTNSDSAHLRIHGLPLTVGSSQAARGGVLIGYQNSGTACVGNGVNSATRFGFFTLTGSDVLFSTFSNKVLRGVYIYSV